MSAVVVPGAFQTSAAHAARRPRLGGEPPVTIHPQASLFTGQPGPVPNGIRLVLDLEDPSGAGTIEFDKLFLPDLGELTTFSPDLFGVGGREAVTLDVGPVLPGQLPSRFQLELVYSYYYDDGSDLEVRLPQQVWCRSRHCCRDPRGHRGRPSRPSRTGPDPSPSRYQTNGTRRLWVAAYSR